MRSCSNVTAARLELDVLGTLAWNAAMAAAIVANPDMRVPTAATSAHPDPPPELPSTAITVVTGGAVRTGLSLAPPPVQAPWRALGQRDLTPFRIFMVAACRMVLTRSGGVPSMGSAEESGDGRREGGCRQDAMLAQCESVSDPRHKGCDF